jgi:uncharacterized protein YndB with AHSA1/START domain
MTARPGDLTLEIDRVIEAPRPVVFAAFTDPDQLARWWGPQGFSVPNLSVDARAGASYRLEMQPPEGDPFYLGGEYRDVDPPARLAFTFTYEEPDEDDVENLVTLEFRDLGESTEIAFSQGPFRTEARRALHLDGWADSFDRLERLVAAG